MSTVNVEPLVRGELLATKVSIRVQSPEGNGDEEQRVTLLLNCGWSLDFDEEKLDVYAGILGEVDAILVTDGDFAHSGALLALAARFRAERGGAGFPKVLCTEGTYKFMRAAFIDVLENVTFTRAFEHYGVEDLEYFNAHCVKLSYRETHCLDRRAGGAQLRTSVCAVNNGYSVGGALWLVSAGFSTLVCGDRIRVYPSTLLNGTSLGDIQRPDLLLLTHEGAERPGHVSDPGGVERCADLDALVDRLVATLSSGGNVLFPAEVDHTLINLLVHLNMIWSTSHLSQFKIVLASPIADKLLLFIGTCLEYMKTSIFHNFIKTLWNPLMDLSRVDIITSLAQLGKYRFSPTLFISTTSSVDFGFTNMLFVAIASYHKNLVVLTKPNDSVTRYMCAQGAQPPQYKLQINLRTGKSEQGDPEPEPESSEERETRFTQFGKLEAGAQFSSVGGRPHGVQAQAGAAQSADRDAKNTQDYGLPFTDLLADPSNPYGYAALPKYEEAFEEQSDNAEDEARASVDDYFRKYIDDAKNSLFDLESESSHDHQPKADLLVKKFPFAIRSQLVRASCFSSVLDAPQMQSLLYRTQPRNVVLVPSSTSSGEAELHLSRLLKTNLHPFYQQHKTHKSEGAHGGDEGEPGHRPSVSVDLNLTNYPVLLDSKLLASVRNFLNRRHTAEAKKGAAAAQRGIGPVIEAIEAWKQKNGREQICQVVSRLTSADQAEAAAPARVVHCHTFWSEEASRRSRLELTLEGREKADAAAGCEVRRGVESTLLVGEVSMSTYARFVDDCLPNSISMDAGSAVVNEKVRVAKGRGEGGGEWLVEGTLDPCYYLARKLLRKLHSRVEPIY